MIDIESRVFDAVYPAVKDLVPAGCFRSNYVPSPPKFPFATLMEIDNRTDMRMRGTSDAEEYAVLTYEADVYAEEKACARKVMNAIDGAMIALGFNRSMMQQIPNLLDERLYRITARYRAAADGNFTIYRHG